MQFTLLKLVLLLRNENDLACYECMQMSLDIPVLNLQYFSFFAFCVIVLPPDRSDINIYDPAVLENSSKPEIWRESNRQLQ